MIAVNPKITGNQITGLIRQTGDIITQLSDGTWEGEVVYICRWADAMRLSPIRYVAAHPDFNTLICKSVKVTRLKPGLVCEMRATYRGFFGPEDVGNSIEEVISSTSEQPIETHPKFVDTLGGTKAAPLNGATFDTNGRFTGFAADSIYAGVESYLVPSLIYRKTTPSRSSPGDVGPVGTIQDPAVGGGQPGSNWLYTSRTWRRDGGVYSVTEEYMLSGPRGWDTTIYSE
jgi:hypothetical protein